MRITGKLALASVSVWAIAVPAFAQDTAPPKDEVAAGTGEIIVEARRRAESIQDVPLTVNAVPAEELQKLNIRNLKDVTAVVPGLALTPNANGVGAVATLRGVNFDVNASGNNGTVEFYIDDQPTNANIALQSTYDIGQIEVLRGPQGTLRGRASPSGSITVTTHTPDLDQWGGYFETTETNIGGANIQGALNVPIIKDMLAVRVAALYEDNEANRVHSINFHRNPDARTNSQRVTVRFDPTPNIDIIGTYQRFRSHAETFDQVESANLALGAPVVGPLITPDDRLSVEDIPRENRFDFNLFNVRAEWRFAGQKLNYVGSWTHSRWFAEAPSDVGDVFTPAFGGSTTVLDPYTTQFNTAPSLQNLAQYTVTNEHRTTHEIRLSSDQRLFGMIDYVVGALSARGNAPIDLWSMQPVLLGPGVPPQFLINNFTQTKDSRALERSIFGNVTLHLGNALEISGGLRYINYKNFSRKFTETQLPPAFGGGLIPKSPLVPQAEEVDNNVIYEASIKYRFNPNLMVYFTTGSSWRASAQTNGLIDGINGQDPLPWGFLAANLTLPGEKSKSYEIGVKSDWLDHRLQLNLTLYHQDFSNYFYSTNGLFIVQRSALGPNGSPNGPNPGDVYHLNLASGPLAIGVPVKVNGVEAEFAFNPNPNFNIAGTLSYSLGKIKNGTIFCNTPATFQALAGLITIPELIASYGGEQVGTCHVNQRSGISPPFSASVQAEYDHPIAGLTGFLRGLTTIYGNSQNVPDDPFDDYKAYALVNLYGGLRGPDDRWELTVYAKNVFNTQRVLRRDAAASSINTLFGPLTSNYRYIEMTAPQEVGINFRVQLGSR